jgi:membrane protease YdiL (CAAX protease family)
LGRFFGDDLSDDRHRQGQDRCQNAGSRVYVEERLRHVRLEGAPTMNKEETGSPTWPVFLAYAVGFLGELLGGVLFVAAVALVRVHGDASRVAAEATRFALSAPGLMGAALVGAAALLAVAWAAARWMGGGVAARLRIGPSRASPQGVATATVGTAGLSLACGSAAQLVHVGEGNVMHALAESLHHATPVTYLAAVASIGLVPALGEESFFRGLMQTRLAERWPPGAAIATSAAAFGLLHLDPVQGTLAFAVGLYLGWLAERFRGIRPGIAAHAANNVLFVTLACFESPEVAGGASTRGASAAVLVLGLSACVASIAFIRTPRALRSSISAS